MHLFLNINCKIPISDIIFSPGIFITVTSITAQDAPVLRSCLELYRAGYRVDAEYKIDPDGPGQGLPAFPVYCDMTNGT